MKNKFIQRMLLSILFALPLMGQYWQQWVEYDMDVYLDSNQKKLLASSKLLYVNNSPDTLDQILMHLYPNAFNEGTIAQQVWEEYGDSFDLEKGWTGIRIQKVVRDSSELAFTIRDDTILEIILDTPLLSGDTLLFSLDWNFIIHPHIDRSGWKGQQFDITQWYPKFVVYDENGWHDDPFGDWGEFYGEFGKFTVNLDLPADQIVAATGVVIDGDPGWEAVAVDTSRVWKEWVEAYKKERDAYLADLDSTARRHVSFLAENVHDFAWLCSPDFVYEHGQWHGIDVHAVFNYQVGEKWTKAVVVTGQNSLQWLSEKFGMFAWPQMTIAKALSGGGMEYPMLVLDYSDSESLAVHEIGHNWFYGMLGNDELDDAWLDEGFTTFQTRWYLEHHYPENEYSVNRGRITPFESANLPRQMYLEHDLKPTIRYMLSPANVPIAVHSFDFQGYSSYINNAYEKPAIMLEMLKNYLGEERFLAGLQLYFSRWSLKHVNEDRFIKAMEDGCGEELDWFFDQWLHTTHYVDYELKDWSVESTGQDHFTTRVHVHNAGGMFVPMTATIYGKTGGTASASLKEFRYRNTGVIEIESDFQPDRVYLDAENVFYDVDRRNNDSQRKRAWRYDYRGWKEYPDDRNLYLWKPRFGYSDLTGSAIGINVRRVYRDAENFIQFGLDENFGSNNPDISLSFRQIQSGLPFMATWSGQIQTWHSLAFTSLAYEMNWAKQFWKNPIHFLTLKLESTDAKYAQVSPANQLGMTRLGIQYELQDNLFSGEYGFSGTVYFSPGKLGNYGSDFTQLSLMNTWKRRFHHFHIKNRLNILANSSATPTLVKSRVASQDLRSVYLNRSANIFQGIEAVETIGSHYYLRGGGRMRAYSDSLDQPMNYICSNNMDLSFQALPHIPDFLDLGMFFDVGQISNNARDWTGVADLGFSLNYKPYWERTSWISTLIRPFQLQFELSILRYENTEWVNMLTSNPWVFTISF